MAGHKQVLHNHMYPVTLLLESLQHVFCCMGQAPERDAASQSGAQEPQGLALRGLMEVIAVFLKP